MRRRAARRNLQDEPHDVNVCALHGLFLKEVMCHETKPSTGQRPGYLPRPYFLRLLDDERAVLYDEVKVRESLSQGKAHSTYASGSSYSEVMLRGIFTYACLHRRRRSCSILVTPTDNLEERW